jgi:hypothetical protein
VQGNGKSTLSRCVAQAVGKRYTHWPKANKLGAQFNSWMIDKIFYAVEDIHVAGMTSEAMFEDLKPMITGEELEIEGKGVDQVSRDICGNFIFNSNHKGGIRKTEDDRRIAVFFTPQQNKADLLRDGMDRTYFRRLRDWLTKENGYAIVTEHLLTWAIPPKYDPTLEMASCPETSTTGEAIEHGRGQIEQEVLEAIAQGKQGFAGGWISSHYFDLMLERFKKDGAIPINRRREILQGLGYDWHPGLALGRVDNVVKPDGTKSKLYVKPDHPTIALRGADVARAYTQAQGSRHRRDGRLRGYTMNQDALRAASARLVMAQDAVQREDKEGATQAPPRACRQRSPRCTSRGAGGAPTTRWRASSGRLEG